jgi:hypothetical protein
MQDLPTDAINLEGEGAAAVIGVDSAALGCAISLLPQTTLRMDAPIRKCCVLGSSLSRFVYFFLRTMEDYASPNFYYKKRGDPVYKENRARKPYNLGPLTAQLEERNPERLRSAHHTTRPFSGLDTWIGTSTRTTQLNNSSVGLGHRHDQLKHDSSSLISFFFLKTTFCSKAVNSPSIFPLYHHRTFRWLQANR